jgi:hypothetical protein
LRKKARALLHLLSNSFATIEVEERIEVQTQAELGAPNAIRFHYEPFRSPKTALLGPFYLRDDAHIRIIFSNFQGRIESKWSILPPFATVKL